MVEYTVVEFTYGGIYRGGIYRGGIYLGGIYRSPQNLYDGEMKTPDLLLHFFQVLYGGLNQSNYSPKLKHHALSSCHDAIFISQHGKVKPVKQIVLGMTVKFMTGSRKLVDLLNRYGHIVSYHTIEEIETSLGENILNMDQTCPEGTVPDQVCGLAFDNFDEIPETLSGAGTLHDTMGILYQNKDVLDKRRDVNQVGQSSSEQYTANRSLSRKRKLQVPDQTLEPYRKKPRLSTFEFDITDVGYRPDHRNNALEMDSDCPPNCYKTNTIIQFGPEVVTSRLELSKIVNLNFSRQP